MKKIYLLGLTVILSACTIDGSKHQFVNYGGVDRAAFEFDCPKESLEVTELAGRTFAVKGCGKKAVYVSVQGSGFVRNSDIQTTK